MKKFLGIVFLDLLWLITEEKRTYECIYNFISAYNYYWSSLVSNPSISIIYIELERKNGKRKNPNVYIL